MFIFKFTQLELELVFELKLPNIKAGTEALADKVTTSCFSPVPLRTPSSSMVTVHLLLRFLGSTGVISFDAVPVTGHPLSLLCHLLLVMDRETWF